jgi:hypothetical protein
MGGPLPVTIAGSNKRGGWGGHEASDAQS